MTKFNTSADIPTIAVGETRLFKVSFVPVLDNGELMTGTPLVTEETTIGLTISNKAISTAALIIKGKTVIIGQAVQFLLSGQLTANSPYTIKIVVTTDSSPAQTIIKYVTFLVDTD